MEAHLAELPTSQLRLSDLAARRATQFDIQPNVAERAVIAKTLDIVGIKKLRLEGEITPVGKTDWELKAKLGATVVQDCVVTLEPVTSRVDEPVIRVYTAHFEVPNEDDVEMTVDENVEPLPAIVDLVDVMIEALALCLPAFPRLAGAELGNIAVTERGITPMSDDDAKPFAGLGDLRKALENKDDGAT